MRLLENCFGSQCLERESSQWRNLLVQLDAQVLHYIVVAEQDEGLLDLVEVLLSPGLLELGEEVEGIPGRVGLGEERVGVESW